MSHLAVADPTEFASVYFGGPGVTAIVAGEVIHVAKCVLVNVETPYADKCCKEIPGMLNNSELFLNIKSRVILPHGITIPCNPIYPPTFKENNNWCKTVPTIVHTVPPKKISHNDIDIIA